MAAIVTPPPDCDTAERRPGVDPGTLKGRILDKTAKIGVIGLGYVGLPLVGTFSGRGYKVVGFDVDETKVEQLTAGKSYIRHIPSKAIKQRIHEGLFRATTDFSEISTVDAIIICVPTPLTKSREPDLSYVEGTAEAILPHLHRYQLIVLESTTYPGTTGEFLRPILERGGLRSGKDRFDGGCDNHLRPDTAYQIPRARPVIRRRYR